MKTFKQFQEEIQYLDEIAPLIPAALSLGGKALAAYSAYSAAKNLARVGSATQSLARYGTDNAFSRGVDKVTQKGVDLVTSPFKGKTANAKIVNTKTKVNNKPKTVGDRGVRYDKAGNQYTRSGKLKLAST